MSNIKDFKNKNTEFTGTKGIDLPEGTEAQRVNEQGVLRFNTDTSLAEYYDGTAWKPIDSPPTISSVSPASPVDDGSTVTVITVSGSNFQSGATCKLVGADATEYSVSLTSITASTFTFNYTSALAAAGTNTPYDIIFTNPSGLAATLEDTFIPNTGPVWVSPAAGTSLGTINIGANASTLTQISVTDTSGGTLVYSVIAGALPSGASINSSTGAISGVVDTAETATFTIQVTDGSTAIDRQFTATIVNPFMSASGGNTTLTSGDFKTHVFTSPGTFTVSAAGTPGGSNTVEYLVVAGGGGAGGGGGGAGGMRYNYPSPATGGLAISATSYPISVGGGGSPGSQNSGPPFTAGANSTFSNITSAGGGKGGSYPCGSGPGGGRDGGSGGGVGIDQGGPAGGVGNTPPVSPPQGSNGGIVCGPGGWRGAGGGGGHSQQGGQGNTGGPGLGYGGNGGNGSPIADTFFGPTAPSYGTPGPAPGRWFAGGGSGGINSDGPDRPQGNGGAGGGGNFSRAGDNGPGNAGTTNTGGGGGGCEHNAPAGAGGAGGSGIVAIRYKFQ